MVAKKIAGIAVLLLCAGLLFAQGFDKPDSWSTFADKADNGDSVVQKETAFEKRAGIDVLKVRLTGKVTTKFQYGYVGMTADGGSASAEALKKGKGITFKVTGDGKQYRVRVETTDVRDFDYYGFVFTAPQGKEVEVTVPYSSLKQEGWGAKKNFNPANASKVSFQTVGQPHASVDFTVIDLKVMN